ncbi:hypothetical protein B0A48_14490 [Cryoendolithus antarcticus]|uniref:F-box domain-containing protein n=1 Tax=Cryoendolithus antarcticus TaxID=1507870 RepID=A0A1V8SLA6_9PEZI|nr:hypothetical protein B0A48_14490 [Cryoendolithus antarcticus]
MPQPTVFEITELLEMILLKLPHNGLMNAQKVCCQWRDTIQKSTRAQQKLFKISSQNTSVATESGTFGPYHGVTVYNNTYRENLDGQFPWNLEPNPEFGVAVPAQGYRLHPHFHCIFQQWIGGIPRFSMRPKIGYKSAWRSTLLLQPAMYRDLVISLGSVPDPTYWIVSVKHGEPLKLGDLYDTIEADTYILDCEHYQGGHLEWRFWIGYQRRTEIAVEAMAKMRDELAIFEVERAATEAIWAGNKLQRRIAKLAKQRGMD